MRIHNSLFLSKANLRGSKKEKTVLVMMVLSVIAVSVLAGFLNVVNSIMDQNKEKTVMRQITIFPEVVHSQISHKGVNENTIDEVLNIAHVISCKPEPYYANQFFKITNVKDDEGKNVSNSSPGLNIQTLSNGLCSQQVDDCFKIKSSAGTQLKDAPVMSCIIPDKGFFYDSERNYFSEIETSELLGKTITIDVKYQIHNYFKSPEGGYEGEYTQIADITYNLKVVGIYHYSNEGAVTGLPSILISDETARKIENMALDTARENNPDAYRDYTDDPYARDYIVTVDSYENVSEVEAKLNELGYQAIANGMLNPTVLLFSSLFSGGGTFLLVAIILLTVINLFLSVYSNINERKSEIGLMKAIGYKSSQIFISMYIENVILAVRAIIAGGLVSTAIVLGINLLNANSGDLIRMSYVMPWSQFGILLLVAFAIILIIPLICQLIMTALITRVQPQEAMNS